MVPFRHKKTYQSDDGRYIEVFTKAGELQEIEVEKGENEKNEEYSPAEKIFIGVAHIPVGPQMKEIKFEIADASTIEDAFSKYHDLAYAAAEEFMKMLQESIIKNQSKIVTAGSGDLQALDQISQQQGGKPAIIV